MPSSESTLILSGHSAFFFGIASGQLWSRGLTSWLLAKGTKAGLLEVVRMTNCDAAQIISQPQTDLVSVLFSQLMKAWMYLGYVRKSGRSINSMGQARVRESRHPAIWIGYLH